MNFPAMIRYALTFTVVFVLIALAGCASPKTATIKNGEVTGLPSHEATTIIKQDNRTKRVNSVLQNSKSIFKVEAQPGQTITFGGVKSIEINVPIDPELLLSDAPDVTSESVQRLREVRGIARETVVPLGLGYQLLQDRKDSRATGLEEARIRAAEQAAQNQSQADIINRVLDKEPIILKGLDIERVD